MQITQPTTPFGRRTMSLAMVAAHIAAADAPPATAAHKWHVLRDLCECRARLGVSERAVTVLNALLTFHPETALSKGDGVGLVVFPSNQQLSLRANGMASATLRRHLAALVEVGLILRRDSPNGKRYARRGAGNAIEVAYGFDLAPLVVRAAELATLAEQVRAERRELAAHREALTLLRRDVTKMIAAGIAAGGQGPWPASHEAYRTIVAALPRLPSLSEVKAATTALVSLALNVRKALERLVEDLKMSGSESQTERHIQNSNKDTLPESEPAFDEDGSKGQGLPSDVRPSTTGPFPIGMVLNACPDIAAYARGGVRTWPDLVAAAGLVGGLLGISQSAWRDAVSVMGPQNAATTIAVILQKGDAVRSAGGYLRSLVKKARIGAFSLGPPLMAFLGGRRGSVRQARQASTEPPSAHSYPPSTSRFVMANPGKRASREGLPQ